MKKTALPLLAVLCASAAFAYDLNTTTSDNPLDISDYNNWNGASGPLTTTDELRIMDSYGKLDSGSLSVGRFHMQNVATFSMNGVGATFTADKLTSSGYDPLLGSNNNSDVVINILGSGNNMNITMGNSLMFGAGNATNASVTLNIESNDALNRNTFKVNGSNTFVRISTNPTANVNYNINIGNYSTYKNETNFYLAGQEGVALAAGSAVITMYGTDSRFDGSDRSFTIGSSNTTAGMAGGEAAVRITGNGNSFITNAMNIGSTVMTGGTASFKVTGNNNIVTFGGLTIGNASSTSSDFASMVIDGSANTFSHGGITINKGSLRFVGTNNNYSSSSTTTVNDGGTLELNSAGATFTYNNNITVNNGGTLIIGGDSTVIGTGMMSCWLYGTDSTLHMIASETGFGDNSFANLRSIEGTLSLDFSKYSIENGEYVKLFTFSTTTGVDQLLANETWDTNGTAILGSKGIYAEGGALYAHVIQVIPEPSTYAAIFGALALAFAAYRRKRA